jgi:exodeoxyribonuclease VII small subunit
MTMHTPPPHESTDEPPSFEAALAELQTIVADLEAGSVGLEESLVRFERGVTLLKLCQQTLEKTEQRIELLVGTNADGTPLTQPFDATATANSEAPTAGRRRSRKAKAEAIVDETPAAEDSDSAALF